MLLPYATTILYIKDKNIKSKQLQYISGQSPFIYWTAYLIFDLLFVFFLYLLILLPLHFLWGQNLQGGALSLCISLTLSMFNAASLSYFADKFSEILAFSAVSISSFFYLYSLLCSDTERAISIAALIALIPGMRNIKIQQYSLQFSALTYPLLTTFYLIEDDGFTTAGTHVDRLFMIFPFYIFSASIYNLDKFLFLKDTCKKYIDKCAELHSFNACKARVCNEEKRCCGMFCFILMILVENQGQLLSGGSFGISRPPSCCFKMAAAKTAFFDITYQLLQLSVFGNGA